MNPFPVPASESLAEARQPKLLKRMRIYFARGTTAFAPNKPISTGRVVPFHSLSRQTPSAGYGRGRGRGVPELFGDGKTGIGFHAELSQGGDPVFTQASFRMKRLDRTR